MRRYSRKACPVCGSAITRAGAGRFAHLEAHARRGETAETHRQEMLERCASVTQERRRELSTWIGGWLMRDGSEAQFYQWRESLSPAEQAYVHLLALGGHRIQNSTLLVRGGRNHPGSDEGNDRRDEDAIAHERV